MSQFEVEIKSLLGTKEKMEKLIEKAKERDPNITFIGEESQLNHYFIGPVNDIPQSFKSFLNNEEESALSEILTKYKNHSVRTRWIAPSTTILVIKASIDDTTSSNGKIRREYEHTFPGMNINVLDSLLRDAGMKYQAKWSRTRHSFSFLDMTLCIDKNAGYGYLAEFEKVVDDESKTEQARESILNVMKELGVKELDQTLLGMMFEYYNQNWMDYYGTDKVFEVDQGED